MQGVLILGLGFLWMVLWAMLIRHERRRAAAGKPRHGALRLLIASAALLTLLFFGGCVVLLMSANPALLHTLNWGVLRFYVGLPFAAAALAFWLAIRHRARGA